ncbi:MULTISPECIES: hypothetical protein [Thermus]|uniref:hypothetical protein n=1 Tax=Thermus TaxID=270 RepID=UPI001F243C88|nr:MULTISPECIES: hypothetical protein [Thermus]
MERALELLKTPKTPAELARALGLTLAGAELLLAQLAQRGYVRPLGCGTGCRGCTFRGLCQGPGETYWVLQPGQTLPRSASG